MKKTERIETANKICSNYSTGKFTIESCCKKEGITYKTFANWNDKYSEITKLYKKHVREKELKHLKSS